MAKHKDRLDKKKPQAAPAPFAGVSKRGWKVVGAGIGLVALGFGVLSLTDPEGQNWASNLSPFLLLGGYAAIGLGIICPDEDESPAGPQQISK